MDNLEFILNILVPRKKLNFSSPGIGLK